MNRQDLALSLVKNFELPKKTAAEIVKHTLEQIKTTLIKNKPVILVGFGSFFLKKKKARNGRNPRTGEAVKVPAKKVVKFKPGKELKALANVLASNKKKK